MDKTILLMGTYDTKADELEYLAQGIEKQGGHCLSMDISVLGDPPKPTTYSKHEVAKAAGVSIQEVIDSGDENSAMQLMALGASRLATELYAQGKFDGFLSIGGSMATDLALDVALALPLGVPKYIVSTIAFSSLIPAERLAADVQMLLWAGGLYGLNSICKASLSQAAGAVLGAARAVEPLQTERPLIGMTSLGKSCLKYMVQLKPELEKRGYEVAIFHSTGMGGRAFENLAEQGHFAAVFDFCTQELANWAHGSCVHAGNTRLLSAGKAKIPQLIAPGAMDLVDLPEWQPLPAHFKDNPYHAHNRLLGSVVLNKEQRQTVADLMVERLAQSQAPVHVFLPTKGIEAWDREGEGLHQPEDLAGFLTSLQQGLQAKQLPYSVLDCHINDQGFIDAALAVFDQWVLDGKVVRGVV